MTANPDRIIEDLKASVDLVALFEHYGLPLKKVGKNHFCRCFLHEEDEASLSVNQAERLWQCFGCKKGGDALTFLQLREKLEFPQALEALRQFAGTSTSSPAVNRAELMERLAQLYHQRFWECPEPQSYLNGRGLTERDVWQAFRIGYCDGSVASKLPTEGPTFDALRQLGILNEEGKEHFRGCLVVPLTHPNQGVVGFYGRRLSPESKIRHLYLPGPKRGVLNWPAFKASSTLYLCESVLDSLSLWQAGVRETTCLHGVAGVPPDTQELLRHFKTQKAVLLLDGDRAGREAAPRLQEQLQELGLEVQRLQLPDDKDPNAMLCELGNTQLADWVHKAGAAQQEQKARHESFSQGFLLELGEVRYEIRMLPPFSSRLRVRLRGFRGESEFLDKIDLYIQRARVTAAAQIAKALQLQRFEAEQHLKLILEKAEDWVQNQHTHSESAPSAKTKKLEMSSEERAEALQFLQAPNLVERILEDMEELGFVGEEHGKLIAYFVGISRKLPKPLSASVISQSSVGKSSLTSMIEFLTPDDEVLHFTRLTSQALYYFPTALSHMLLILEERVGAEAADYSIRALQSSHKLTQAVPIKDPMTGQYKTQIMEVYGPVAYIETTTNPKMNHENATRSFEIYLDESEEQTRRIQEAQRRARMAVDYSREARRLAIQRRHHHAQKLLEPGQICIPYAEHITFPSHRLRTRRDHDRFLCLIEASAFLHQHQRQKGVTQDGEITILASLEDYAIAYKLARELLSSTLHELHRPSFELWQKIRDWVAEEMASGSNDHVFTRRDLRQRTGLEDHRLRETLNDLVEMEYVEAIAGGNGKQFRYRLLAHDHKSGRLPLLTPEELAQRIEKPCGPCEGASQG